MSGYEGNSRAQGGFRISASECFREVIWISGCEAVHDWLGELAGTACNIAWLDSFPKRRLVSSAVHFVSPLLELRHLPI